MFDAPHRAGLPSIQRPHRVGQLVAPRMGLKRQRPGSTLVGIGRRWRPAEDALSDAALASADRRRQAAVTRTATSAPTSRLPTIYSLRNVLRYPALTPTSPRLHHQEEPAALNQQLPRIIKRSLDRHCTTIVMTQETSEAGLTRSALLRPDSRNVDVTMWTVLSGLKHRAKR